MASFTNQATLSFNGNVISSNIATGEIRESLSIVKSALSNEYSAFSELSYAISLTNSANTALDGITLSDDLGAYSSGGALVRPLSFREGSVRYFVNGVLSESPEASVGADGVLNISGISVPAGGNAMVIYRVLANSFAPLAAGSVITNTATASGTALTEQISDSEQVGVSEDPVLSITKSISPAVVSDNGQISYSFTILNTGNSAATAEDDIILSDLFNPIVNITQVSFNGTPWSEGTNYSYDEATGLFTTLAGQITVGAASYTVEEDGSYSVIPGSSVLTVVGRI